ncbi:MAG: hypothetical protein JNL80_17155 [Phycisphaerae bacterium]|nr:hypothetical protein [Phycisphaerae bacterium]
MSKSRPVKVAIAAALPFVVSHSGLAAGSHFRVTGCTAIGGPSQVQTAKDSDPRGDVNCFGCIHRRLFEMC